MKYFLFRHIIIVLLLIIKYDLFGQTPLIITINHKTDTIEIGQENYSYYTLSGNSTGYSFVWEYNLEDNFDFFNQNSKFYSSNDTIHYSYFNYGLYHINLYVYHDQEIEDTIFSTVFVKGVASLPCLSSPTPCELVCNWNLEETAPDNPATASPDLVYGLNQLYEGVGYNNFNPQAFPSCNTTCNQSSQYLIFNSPDYFSTNNMWGFNSTFTTGNPCTPGNNPIDVPNNFAGSQGSHLSGGSYAGFIGYINDPVNYYYNQSISGGINTREYVAGSLFTPLVANQTYYVSFWVSLADNSNFAIDNIGIKFFSFLGNGAPNSDNTNFKYSYIDLIPEPCSNCPFPEITGEIIDDNNNVVTPDVINQSGIISDKLNWVEISGTFVASGGENKFIIGNFSNDANTNSLSVSGSQLCMINTAYYYVDDISVSTVPTSVSITASPNPVCEGQPVVLTASPTLPTATYTWYDSNGIPIITGQGLTSITVTPTSSTNYTVKLFTQCDDPEESITINVLPLPTVNAGSDQSVCQGSIVVLVANGSESSYDWYNGANYVGSSTNGQPLYLSPINGSTTFTAIATNSSGCQNTDDVIIDLYPLAPILISAPKTSCCENPIISVNSDYTSYDWTISPSVLFSGQGTNTINLTLDPDEDYVITITVTDANGCTQSETVTILECCKDYSSDFTFSTDPCATSKLSDYLSGGVSAWPSNPGITPTSMSGMVIQIANDLIIDVNYSLTNGTVFRIYPGAKIIVDPGVTFTVDNSRLIELCDEMWDGVYVEDASSFLFIQNGSLARQAINAVVTRNGGDITLNRSTFSDCHKGVVIEGYAAGTYPASITGCTFNTSNGLLYVPHLNEQMHKGIEVNLASIVDIGQTGSTNMNFFNKMDYGIHITSTSANIINNDFKNIKHLPSTPTCFPCGCDLGTAVCAQIVKNVPNPFIRVGGTVNETNFFNKNHFGTTVLGGYNIDILTNDFSNHSGGVSVYNASGKIINVNDNSFRNFVIGTGIYDIPKATLSIKNNTYNNGITFLPNVSNTAIHVNHSLPNFFAADISQNQIKKVRNGIFFINASGLASPFLPPQIFIHDNDITFNQLSNNNTGGINHTGIRMDYCRFININNNNIKKPGNTTSNLTTALEIEGIRLNGSQLMIVDNNFMKHTGYGISVMGSCNPSILKCNEMDRCFNGVNFSNLATIGNQLNSGQPTGNLWTGPGTLHSVNFDLAGSLSTPIDWFYNSNNGGDFVPTDGTVAGSFNSLQNVAVADQCGNPAMLTPPQEREKRLGKIVRNENAFSANGIEHRLNEMLFAYTELEKNNSWLTLGTTDDSTYQNFYNNCQNNCISGFAKTYLNTEDENYITAKNFNSTVNVNNDWEYYQKRVNEIYLNSKVDSLPISSADSLELNDIAYLHSAYYGPGVFSARAILKLEVEDLANGTTRMIQIINEEENSSISSIELYPNPNTGKFILQSENSLNNFNIVILDITGKIVFEILILEENNFEFDLNLPNGIYLLQVKNKDELIEGIKLIIAK